MVCAMFEPLYTCMICVLSFLYSSRMSLLFNENFSSRSVICVFSVEYLFSTAFATLKLRSIEMFGNTLKNIEIEHLKYGDCNLIWAIPDKVVH